MSNHLNCHIAYHAPTDAQLIEALDYHIRKGHVAFGCGLLRGGSIEMDTDSGHACFDDAREALALLWKQTPKPVHTTVSGAHVAQSLGSSVSPPSGSTTMGESLVSDIPQFSFSDEEC